MEVKGDGWRLIKFSTVAKCIQSVRGYSPGPELITSPLYRRCPVLGEQFFIPVATPRTEIQGRFFLREEYVYQAVYIYRDCPTMCFHIDSS